MGPTTSSPSSTATSIDSSATTTTPPSSTLSPFDPNNLVDNFKKLVESFLGIFGRQRKPVSKPLGKP